MVHEPTMERQRAQTVDDVAEEFRLPHEVVEPLVSEAFRIFSDSRITSFVPILARRHVRERLRLEARGVVA
jgi:uncharacterized Fe-S cluster-containing radical SAM superfamily protein